MPACNFRALSKYLVAACETLKKIYADDIADECLRYAERLKSTKHEIIEAYVTYFLTSVSMLSIDIQMAIRDKSHQSGGVGFHRKTDRQTTRT